MLRGQDTITFPNLVNELPQCNKGAFFGSYDKNVPGVYLMIGMHTSREYALYMGSSRSLFICFKINEEPLAMLSGQ